MNAFAFSPHALLDRLKLQWQEPQLKKQNQLSKHNIPQRSLSSPPKYIKTEPAITFIKKPPTAIITSLKVSSPFTKGCKSKKTKTATEIFKKVFPSSLATFLNLFIKIIITDTLRAAR